MSALDQILEAEMLREDHVEAMLDDNSDIDVFIHGTDEDDNDIIDSVDDENFSEDPDLDDLEDLDDDEYNETEDE